LSNSHTVIPCITSYVAAACLLFKIIEWVFPDTDLLMLKSYKFVPKRRLYLYIQVTAKVEESSVRNLSL